LNQGRRLAEEVVESDGLGRAVTQLVDSQGEWEGTATELVSTLAQLDDEAFSGRSKAPQSLSGRLKRLAPSLASIGIVIDFDRESGFDRQRQIRLLSTKKSA
jgi:hypothetical protein